MGALDFVSSSFDTVLTTTTVPAAMVVAIAHDEDAPANAGASASAPAGIFQPSYLPPPLSSPLPLFPSLPLSPTRTQPSKQFSQVQQHSTSCVHSNLPGLLSRILPLLDQQGRLTRNYGTMAWSNSTALRIIAFRTWAVGLVEVRAVPCGIVRIYSVIVMLV